MIKLYLGSDGELCAIIPSTIEGREQHVSIPFTLDGLRILKRVVTARARGPQKLGSEAEPTQALIYEWLKAERQRQLEADLAGVPNLELEIEI